MVAESKPLASSGLFKVEETLTLESVAPLSDVWVYVQGDKDPVSKSPLRTVGAGVQTDDVVVVEEAIVTTVSVIINVCVVVVSTSTVRVSESVLIWVTVAEVILLARVSVSVTVITSLI